MNRQDFRAACFALRLAPFALLSVLVLTAPAAPAAARQPAPVAVQAHRGGAALWPENTLAAFRGALGLGVDWLEMDLHLTKDGEIVVIHDPTVDRTTDGTGKVRDMTLAELQTLDAGSRRNFGAPAVPGERVPTLQAVLDLVREAGDGAVRLNVETKIEPGETPSDFEARVVDLLRRNGFLDRVCIQSFDPASLARVRALDASVETALLVQRIQPGGPVAATRNAAAQWYSPNSRLLELRDVVALHAAGLRVVPWTVDEDDEARRLIAMDVDAVITNRPDALLALLRSLDRHP